MISLQLCHQVQSVLSRLAFRQDPVEQRHALISLGDELQLSTIQWKNAMVRRFKGGNLWLLVMVSLKIRAYSVRALVNVESRRW